MSQRYDRRAFLRRLGGVGLCAPALPLLACGDGGSRASASGDDGGGAGGGEARRAAGAGGGAGAGGDGPAESVSRPILEPWGDGAVRIVSPLDALPMAYVSMGRRQVFVDYAFRDRSNWVLEAHISVSTGVWRIPLPGDPDGVPIPPGDLAREFEELDIAEWDPSIVPAEGDFRIRMGRPAPLRIDFSCVPVAATGAWISGGPWDVRGCDGVGEEACREDFVQVGTGSRHPIRGCGDPPEPVALMTWVCPA